MLHALLGVFAGLITPVQTAVNTRLGRSIGSPLRASMVSFSVGLAALLALTLVLGPYPLVPSSAADGPWWMWLAGLFGAAFLTGNVLLLPRLGSLKTVIMPVTGQIVMGLLIDVFGWFGAQQREISLPRIAGTLIALAGFLIAVTGSSLRLRIRDDNTGKAAGKRETAHADAAACTGACGSDAGSRTGMNGKTDLLWSLAGIAFGMCSAVQTALLGRLGTALDSPIKAALVSFAVGLLALLVVIGVTDRTYSLGTALHKGNPWWMWIGGLMGATLVMCNSYLSSRIGTGMTVMLLLLGQVGGGLAVDRFGLLGVPRKRVSAIQYVGVLVAVVGIVLKAL